MFEWMSANAGGAKRIGEMGDVFGGDPQGVSSGMVAGTRVATSMGWRPVEAIAEGDLVLTFDAGLQAVTKVARAPIWSGEASCPKRHWPLLVPAGALGNMGEIQLLPNQYVMVESDAGEDLYGDPFSLIHSSVLDGVNGIEPAPLDCRAESIVLHFNDDQVVFAESGVLFYCPPAQGFLAQMQAPIMGEHSYRALTPGEAELLVGCIESERTAEALWRPAPVPATREPVYAMT